MTFQDNILVTSKIRLTGYAVTAVTDYQPTLYKIPEDFWKTVV